MFLNRGQGVHGESRPSVPGSGSWLESLTAVSDAQGDPLGYRYPSRRVVSKIGEKVGCPAACGWRAGGRAGRHHVAMTNC